MPRLPRNEVAGATYHVIARGVNRQRMFVDEDDYRTYRRLLAIVVADRGWHLLCYCLMPNHVHLMVETPETNLGKGMQWLHGEYATYFNQRHVRVGPLFQGRFKSPKVKTEEAFIRLVGYIAANPVAARLCKRAAEWRWGSHAEVCGPSGSPGWLAHKRLVDHLEEITSSRCYEQLVRTWERRKPEEGV